METTWFNDLDAAGKAFGQDHGYEGRTGGWIYREGNAGAVCQGWHRLGTIMLGKGIIRLDPETNRYYIPLMDALDHEEQVEYVRLRNKAALGLSEETRARFHELHLRVNKAVKSDA